VVALERDALQQALALTRSMDALAAQGEWEQIGQLDDERMSLLENALRAGVSRADKPFVIELLQQIQSHNEALRQLAGTRRLELKQAMGLLQKRKEASAAYDACQKS
jgi:hypothetical protein